MSKEENENWEMETMIGTAMPGRGGGFGTDGMSLGGDDGITGLKRRSMDTELYAESEVLSDTRMGSKRYLSSSLATQLRSLRLTEKSTGTSSQQTPGYGTENLRSMDSFGTGMSGSQPSISRDPKRASQERAIIVYQPVGMKLEATSLLDVMQKRMLEQGIQYQDNSSMAIIPFERALTLEETREKRNRDTTDKESMMM
eukprot:CAMPEP_0184745784 /NCGR_PEP_ID=MMETSP0315-20130426/8472_1 /TAXON_ID=101924 /ORGANISM="Rhodosorus marinus, Strain UTEX LB 2760" /LENGTH=198 /DNA_ID=CAMNT_0027218133 /DNA_START=116 /DNA_END=712 /DNA_ORIENTATION=+